MELNYKKNNNDLLFETMINMDMTELENIQNYIPIYNKFFNLSDTNYNSINLNNKYSLHSLDTKLSYSKFEGSVVDSCNNKTSRNIFFKYSPLIDATKYMIGKYDLSYNILILPKFINNDEKMHNRLLDYNNSAYVDGFFSYLSSFLLNKYKLLNGIDFYGSFLGIKKNFIVEITEDIEFLDDSDFFHSNKNNLFKLIENSNTKHLFKDTKKNREKLDISFSDNEDLVNDIIDLNITDLINVKDVSDFINETGNLTLEYNEENTDTNTNTNTDTNTNTNTKNENNKDNKKRTNDLNTSQSSCSSRYSKTDSDEEDSNEEEETDSDNDDDDDDDSSSSQEGEDIFMEINKFPVQIIALECCHDTLDSYIVNNKIKDLEWESIILQILFTLITYQKVFNFTHNDLHTNNIVYIETDKKYIYYKYNNKHYKVPTFGKIYKIIDFGRAVYTLKNNIICSDSYSPDGDAYTQYNCEPYFNENKARIEPNYSFDLCRLGCSLFDYFIDDIDDIKKLKSVIKKIMISWVFDDNNKNILYKNDGSERYPDFKLYKMIARIVHNHTPEKVLKHELFDNYLIARKKINNVSAIINIDEMPIMC
tara:strand:+ start:1856 stop:3634 length:1779 start_codon:yes stop_codon:yes gene_type:complete